MSARHSTACLALAALCGLLTGAATASAKPPDLPEEQEVICTPDAPPPAATAETAPAEVDVQAATAWCNALRMAQRCLLCGAHPLVALLPDQCLLGEEYEEAVAAWLAGRAGENAEQDAAPYQAVPPPGTPVSPPQGMPPPATAPVRPKNSGFTCPYLREQDARQHRTQPCPLATPSDVLGNLHKLEEAQKAVERGDYYRDTEHPDTAAYYYEIARRLCPGSRYARIATEQLHRLAKQRAEAASAAEDQEVPSSPHLVSATYPVRDLIDAGHGPGSARRAKAGSDDAPAGALMRRIATTVHPQSWSMMGGPGTISYDSDAGVLTVCQTPDVQEQVAEFLAVLRCRAVEEKKSGPTEEEGAPASTKDQPGDEEQSVAPADGPRVGALLESCQRAFRAGKYARAEKLARRALALDADAVASHPLVYKQHLLTNLAAKVGHPIVVCSGTASEPEAQAPEQAGSCAQALARFSALYREGLYAEAEQCALQGLALDPGNPALAAAAQIAAAHCRMKASPPDESSCPSVEPPCTLRQPELPPVDPGVPAAMDKVLTTAGEPAEDKLQITVEESSGGSEEAEPAGADGPSEGKPAEAAGDQGCAPCGADWWRDLADLLRTAACAEVEGRPAASRGCCRVPLGCMTGEVAWDNRGEHSSFTLTLEFFGAPEHGAGPRKQDAARP